ncbi:MAG: hypothetical protein ACOVOD_03680 [Rhodoferax sp.]|jgi:hypothetical protein
MTRDDIIRLIESNELTLHGDIEHFAHLVAAAEREACAQLCLSIEQSQPLTDRLGWEHGTMDCLLAIRARGDSNAP